MSNGFIKIRRGLEEHLISGVLSLAELGAYVLIHLQADYQTGVWTGSAPRLVASCPRGSTLRDAQRILEKLAGSGFIKPFHTQGKRGNYRVLIHKYEPQFGVLKGKRLNATASTSWKSPVYELCVEDALTPRSRRADAVADSDAEERTDSGTEAAPYLEVEGEKTEREKKKKKSHDDDRARAQQIEPEGYINRVDRFREEILACVPGDKELLNAALDLIDQRAWDKGTRIVSVSYFGVALENFLRDKSQVKELKQRLLQAKQRRKRWMPGFDETKYSTEPDPHHRDDIAFARAESERTGRAADEILRERKEARRLALKESA